MEMSKFWNALAIIDSKHAKRHTMRIGSAVTLKDGAIIVNVETAPLNGWDGTFRLVPVPEDTNEEG